MQPKDPYVIPRKEPHLEKDSFASLRQEGIRLAQQFSGKTWTDYNEHDPGVTILEQLCYALTELSYRADFPVKDFLADEKGMIDTDYQALFRPEDIMTCRPTTMGDIISAIIDAIPAVDFAWVDPILEGPARGLYLLTLRLNPTVSEALNGREEELLEEIRRVYGDVRNLCEDVADIQMAEETRLVLHANLDLASGINPSEILAEIYYQCGRRLSGASSIHNYEDEKKAGMNLEQIFTGPLTRNAVFRPGQQLDPNLGLSDFTFNAIIQSISGVERINSLYFTDAEGQPYHLNPQPGSRTAFRLLVPGLTEQGEVILCRKSAPLTVTMEDFRMRYEQRLFRDYTLRYTEQNLTTLYQVPQGRPKKPTPYYSIQHQFPYVYGINAYGIPSSESNARKGQAKQLKAYLLLFEQLLANFLANTDGIRELFSIENDKKRSYFFQALEEPVIPNATGLYVNSPSVALKKIVHDHDPYYARKGRLLDYLLALYGEEFKQNALRRFDCYHTGGNDAKHVLAHKLRYLQMIVEVGKNRAAGMNYQLKSNDRNQLTGFELKLYLRLGLRSYYRRSLCMGMLNENLSISRKWSSLWTYTNTPSPHVVYLDVLNIEEHENFKTVPLIPLKKKHRLRNLRKAIRHLFPIKERSLAAPLLHHGIDIGRYRMGRFKKHERYQVVFQADDGPSWWYLGHFPDKKKAILAVNALRQYLLHLNIASEGFHLLEHILLRPIHAEGHSKLKPEELENFFSFKMSVILPNWTARFSNPQFQAYVEQTIREHCPAHIVPIFHWYNFKEMVLFEDLYKSWIKSMRTSEENSDFRNLCASRLIRFLLKREHRKERRKLRRRSSDV